jgi:hypothetical protein
VAQPGDVDLADASLDDRELYDTAAHFLRRDIRARQDVAVLPVQRGDPRRVTLDLAEGQLATLTIGQERPQLLGGEG